MDVIQMQQKEQQESIFKRFLWLYGLYTLLNMISFLVGYYLLPEGFMRGSPQLAVSSLVASAPSFWGQFSLTLLFNLGAFVICVLTNLQRFHEIPMGCIVLIVLGITSGLISGTNSFSASDLKQFNAWDGTAMGMSIGGVEMIAYVVAIAATVNIGLYEYNLQQWRGTKIKNWRDIRLTTSEILCLCLGILLLILAAYRETVMAMNL
ncbi:MAG TPA: hypothetical protein PLS98_04375 [Dictyoglomaceae bacterium]|nr:hypothetical protein [Dictyoglomaceae bacterium]